VPDKSNVIDGDDLLPLLTHHVGDLRDGGRIVAEHFYCLANGHALEAFQRLEQRTGANQAKAIKVLIGQRQHLIG
jgi:hypothetical protein